MSLPVTKLPTDTVTVDGQSVEVRGLSRAEAYKLATGIFKDDPDAGEVYILTCGTGASEDEVKAWRETTDMVTAGVVVDRILALSGMSGSDGKDPQ